MSKSTLSKDDKQNLGEANTVSVSKGAVGVKTHLENNQRWLDSGNVYGEDAAKTLNQRKASNDEQLLEYLAASVPQHCLDGWTYLSRALDCHTRGDAHGAIHLAYYAELRATMCLLAGQSVGILNHKHFVFDSKGSLSTIESLGTHQVAWLALSHWSKSRGAEVEVGNMISLANRPLIEWLTEAGFPSSAQSLAAKWLQEWGLDLELMTKDRDLRNAASYRPTCLTNWTCTPAPETTRVLERVWSLFEPSGTWRFDGIDQYLIRNALESGYKGSTGKDPSARGIASGFDQRIRTATDKLGLTTSEKELWIPFLLRETSPDEPWLLRQAKIRGDSPRTQYTAVIARAALLLRIATGTARQLSIKGSWSRENLSFWWNTIGLDAGLWDEDDVPESLSDLWADVAAALDDIGTAEVPPDTRTIAKRSWQSRKSAALLTLGGAQRIGMWGLGL